VVAQTESTPVVIARRSAGVPGAYWEARVGIDRSRLELVLSVQPHTEVIEVPALTDAELQALLSEAPTEQPEVWCCSECGYVNSISRRWCSACSNHRTA
jgi:hypothetical protein